ncbi:MAG: hypothetical protein E3J72_01900 [Planctomycetota bacterium]|nr:MAG: hypothetical protein E3J72_01900 [Planctomycetota bacterium]
MSKPVHILIQIALAILLNASMLWFSIGVIDRGNRKNKKLAAIGWSFVHLGAAFWPLIGSVVGLFVLVIILFNYYDLSVIKAFLVIVLLIALRIGLLILFAEKTAAG